MSQPYRCPVCEGRQTVPKGFYGDLYGVLEVGRETCRTCEGYGVLWSLPESWEPDDDDDDDEPEGEGVRVNPPSASTVRYTGNPVNLDWDSPPTTETVGPEPATSRWGRPLSNVEP